jgi:hypothetical protein
VAAAERERVVQFADGFVNANESRQEIARANEAQQWVDDITRYTNRDTRYTQAVMLKARSHIHLLARLLHAAIRKGNQQEGK